MVQVAPYTITGLAISVGLGRQGLINYANRDSTMMDTITRAKHYVERYTESALFNNKQARGAEFALKNNYKGWEDRKVIDSNETRHLTVAQIDMQIGELVKLLGYERAGDAEVIEGEVVQEDGGGNAD